ncbi:MAG: TonB-dependent receptor domain-containing protein [Terracidiphilus sp.]
MTFRRPFSLLVTLFFFLAAARLADGQSETATIRGVITDQTGAVVPGAAVRLLDTDRGTALEAMTGAEGSYILVNVYPGNYRLEVEKSGFKLIRVSGITVNVLDSLERNFTLDVGSASESVNVTAETAHVDTTDGTVSTVVDRNLIDNLPLNGRSFQTLIMLTPGVVVTSTAYDDQGQFSVNGQRADGNYFTIDGVSANFGVTGYGPMVQSASGSLPALSMQGGTNSLVSADAMQEFRVQTSTFAPEFGRTPGGQISIVTRSGTNAFHGNASEYFRNDVLDAPDWFVDYNHLKKPAERQNDFGGVFGGPIVRDNTFFFFSYEGLRLRQPLSQQTVVPDPASRQQAPAAMQPYLAAYPVPNGPELGTGSAQFNASFSDPSSLDSTSIRIDHQLSSKWSLFGRYDNSPSSQTVRAPNQGYEPNLATIENDKAKLQTMTLGLTGVLNSRISNEARANYSNDRFGKTFKMDSFGGAAPLADSALFPSGYSSRNGEFSMEIKGVGELLQGRLAGDEQRQINVVDNLSASNRNHAMKFGVDYRWMSPFSGGEAYRQFVEFTGMQSTAGGALSAIAFEAAPFSFQPDALLVTNYSFYGQDTWKLTARATLTYGLRWDINPSLKGKNMANQPFTVTGLNNPATMMLAPRGTRFYQTTYGDVAPRVGIAYRIGQEANHETVLRAGFGVFYDVGGQALGGASSYFPFSADKILLSVPFPLSADNATPPPLSTSPPVASILVSDPHLKLPRTYEWNAAVEQSLGVGQTFSITYVGAIGRDLLRATYLLNPNPNFQFVDVTSNSATSDYHAMQVKFEQRMARGLQGLASYTWSHSIDIASTDAFANYLNTPISIASPNVDRADSDFDIRNSFTAGVTYSLPSPQSGRLVRAALGGWSIDSFVLARTAPPVDIIGNISFAGGTAIYPRPNVIPGVPQVLHGSQYPGGKIFNKAAFTAPPAGQQGNFDRNVLRGFGAFQGDFAVQRVFAISERLHLDFRSEFFNILNHPNFGPPTNSLTSALFGYSTQSLASSLAGADNAGFNPLYQIGGPRSIQLAAKLQF